MDYCEKYIRSVLARADIQVDGTRPSDILVKDKRFYKRVFTGGVLGLGESYMDGDWECDSLDSFIARAIKGGAENKIEGWRNALHMLSGVILNLGSKSRAREVGEKHYNVGNDLYKRMLGKSMAYTCGYWDKAKTLDAAQEAKFELICKKIGIKEGMRVLDIGCGWGSFAHYIRKNYKASVLGVTISSEQVALAKELYADDGVEIRLEDYRDVKGKFDRIVSIGMFEHVGYKNYRTYMEKVSSLLTDNGIFLLHVIGKNFSTVHSNPWIHKYIFPNGMLPSVKQIGEAIDNLLIMEDWHNFGPDYDKTLMAWHENFKANWDEIKGNYDERFYRMWEFYLLSCAGAFRARDFQLWQLVLTKKGVCGGYASVR
jgi:cyclopropane-fatty-acyl-phospholipid synthase